MKITFKERIKQIFCDHSNDEITQEETEWEGIIYKETTVTCTKCKTGYVVRTKNKATHKEGEG